MDRLASRSSAALISACGIDGKSSEVWRGCFCSSKSSTSCVTLCSSVLRGTGTGPRVPPAIFACVIEGAMRRKCGERSESSICYDSFGIPPWKQPRGIVSPIPVVRAPPDPYYGLSIRSAPILHCAAMVRRYLYYYQSLTHNLQSVRGRELHHHVHISIPNEDAIRTSSACILQSKFSIASQMLHVSSINPKAPTVEIRCKRMGMPAG